MNKKVITKVKPLSLAKMMGLGYLLVCFLAGVWSVILAFQGSQITLSDWQFGVRFIFTSLVLIPLVYGIGMFLLGLVLAFGYNFLARFLGGVEITVE